jgi:NAD(P)-dependent dehydrogenase (short-subunit alcohol dehydrogenase family)
MGGHAAYAELVRALAREGARVLVVGSLAKRIHGLPVQADDPCLWYDAEDSNAARVYRALARVGAPLDGVEIPDLADVTYEFRYTVRGEELCLLGGLDGVTFADAWPERLETAWGQIALCVIGPHALRASALAERV